MISFRQANTKWRFPQRASRKEIVSSVEALVGNTVEVSQRLEIGEINSTIVVEGSAGAVQINTQDGTLGNTIVSNQITQLPMEARNVQALLTLQPGVTPGGYVAGARSDQSNITLDGVRISTKRRVATLGARF